MIIQVTDNYRIFHDGYNWRISEYLEPKEFTKGFLKGKTSKGGWKEVERFYPHAEMALKWILTQDVFLSGDDCVTVEEFKDYLEEFYSRVKEDMRAKLESNPKG